jgi:hypothetical protein
VGNNSKSAALPFASATHTSIATMADCEEELALRAHIRNLLLDYALTHLTTNYITFTEDKVDEVSPSHRNPFII